MLNQKITTIFSGSRLYILIATCFFSLWSFPNLLWSISGGLDPSWVLGIHMATMRHLIFGTDIIWTYGPLGYLLFPIYISRELWLNSIFFQLISYFLIFTMFCLFFIKEKTPLKHVIVIYLITTLYAKGGEGYILVIGLFLAYYLYLNYSKNKFLLSLISISTSILFLIKFDIAIASFGLLTFFCLYLAIQKRKTEFIVSISSFVISIAIIWLILGGSPTQFFAYVSNSLMISSTYDAAMSADQLAIITTPLIIISWAVLFLIIFTEKKYPKNFRLLFLSLVLLFISYKHGVVRNDLHVLDFFFGWAILLYIYRSSISKKIDFRGTKIITFCLVGILVSSAILVANSTGDLLISKITSSAKNVISAYSNSNIVSIPTYFEFIVNPSILEQTKINEKDSLRSYYNFSSQILNTVKNNRIDVIPQEIALLYAYDMNWSPRPTMQTQVDIVPRLDNVTSQYFTNVTSAPKFVLYQITTIDNRFPEFDEPLTLKAILCNYKTIGLSGNMWLLQLNNNQCTNPNLLTTEYVSFNQTVSVPQSKSDLLFAKIYINYNLLGEISKLLYKPPQIHFIDKQQNYRFVQSTASDGILLSYSNKIQSAFPMLNYNFSSFRIDTDQKYYENKIKIEFFGMNGSFPKSIVPFSNIVSNPIDMLLKIYANRPDLQAVAPEVKSGDLKGLLNWARTEGPNEYAELGPLKPLFDLLQVYYSRPDLQKAFPEVIQEHKIHNLIQWAAQYGIHEEPTLKTDERYFVRYLS